MAKKQPAATAVVSNSEIVELSRNVRQLLDLTKHCIEKITDLMSECDELGERLDVLERKEVEREREEFLASLGPKR